MASSEDVQSSEEMKLDVPSGVQYISDDRHPVGNLLSGNGKKRWLSAPKLKTGQIEAVFELERPCVITHIDIGSVWCANIEVQVGRSSCAQGVPYKSMVATANLMSPVDCRNSNAFIKTRMFKASDFMEDVRDEEWDRLRLICRQPFRKDVQFGLSFIRITGNFSDNSNTRIQSPNRNTNHNGNPTQSSPFSGAKTPRMEDVIPRHNTRTTPARTAELQNRLLKIAGSAENGTANEVSLSRTARLVLAAADQSPRFSPTLPSQHNHKSRLLSNSVDSRTGPSFKAEVRQFLSCLQLTEEDLSMITIADLRHRLEKRKRRKLTREEKKQFISLTQEFLQAKFENNIDEPENDGDTEAFVDHILDKTSLTDSSTEHMSISDDIYMDDLSCSSAQLGVYSDSLDAESSQSHKTAAEVNSPMNVHPQTDSGLPATKSPRELSKGSKPLMSTPYKKLLLSKPKTLSPPQPISPSQNELVDNLPEVVEGANGLSNAVTAQASASPSVKDLAILKPGDNDIQLLYEIPSLVETRGPKPQVTLQSTPVPLGAGIFSSVSTSTTTTIAATITKRKISAKDSSSRKNCKIEQDYKTRTVKVKVPSSAKRVPSSEMITIHCIQCGKMVPEQNYLLHQVHCKNLTKKKNPKETATPMNPRTRAVRTPVPQTHPDIVIQVDEWRSPHASRMVTCPICLQNFPEADIQVHADMCAEL